MNISHHQQRTFHGCYALPNEVHLRQPFEYLCHLQEYDQLLNLRPCHCATQSPEQEDYVLMLSP